VGDPYQFEATVNPSTVVFDPAQAPDADTRQTQTRDVEVHVSANRFADAYHSERIEVRPVVEDDPRYRADTLPTSVFATPAWRPGLDVDPVEQELTVSAGDSVHGFADVLNTGNGPGHVSLESWSAPDGCSVDPVRDAIEVPKKASREHAFHVACEASAEGGQVELVYEQSYAVDRSVPDIATDRVTFSVDVEDESVGPKSAGLGLAALAGAFGLAHRRFGD
jgi:hypothetical protein